MKHSRSEGYYDYIIQINGQKFCFFWRIFLISLIFQGVHLESQMVSCKDFKRSLQLVIVRWWQCMDRLEMSPMDPPRPLYIAQEPWVIWKRRSNWVIYKEAGRLRFLDIRESMSSLHSNLLMTLLSSSRVPPSSLSRVGTWTQRPYSVGRYLDPSPSLAMLLLRLVA